MMQTMESPHGKRFLWAHTRFRREQPHVWYQVRRSQLLHFYTRWKWGQNRFGFAATLLTNGRSQGDDDEQWIPRFRGLTSDFLSLRKDQCTRLWKESDEKKASFQGPGNLGGEMQRPVYFSGNFPSNSVRKQINGSFSLQQSNQGGRQLVWHCCETGRAASIGVAGGE